MYRHVTFFVPGKIIQCKHQYVFTAKYHCTKLYYKRFSSAILFSTESSFHFAISYISKFSYLYKK